MSQRTFRSASMGPAKATSAGAATLILIVGLASVSSAQGLNLKTALNVGVVASGTADYVTTRQAIHRGAREANPIVGDGALRQALVKGLGIGGVIGLASWVESKGHRTWSQAIRVIAISAWSAAAIHNGRVYR